MTGRQPGRQQLPVESVDQEMSACCRRGEHNSGAVCRRLGGEIDSSYEETAAKIEMALRRNLCQTDDRSGSDTASSGSEFMADNNNCLDADGSSIIDVRMLPGYQPVPSNCPVWKRTMIEKKNKRLEEDAMREMLAKRQEEARWRNIPEWKKSLIMEKEKKRHEELQALQCTENETADRLGALPEWKRDLVIKKRSQTSSASDQTD